MRVYISGPMTGLPRHGFPAFFEAEKQLRASGYDPISPARLSIARVQDDDRARGVIPLEYEGNEHIFEIEFAKIPRHVFLRQDTAALLEADAVATLPGWPASDGARYEVDVARRIGIPVFCRHMRELGLDDCDDDIDAEIAETDRRADPSGAVKADVGKNRLELLPNRPLWGIAEILTFGARKYADHNWRKGFEWSRMYGAMQRHLTAWWEGEDLDPETGKSHLWHAGCDLLFLAEYEITGTGTDDRYKP